MRRRDSPAHCNPYKPLLSVYRFKANQARFEEIIEEEMEEEEKQKATESSQRYSPGIIPTIFVKKVSVDTMDNENDEYGQPDIKTVIHEELQGKAINQKLVTTDEGGNEKIGNHPNVTKRRSEDVKLRQPTATYERSFDLNVYADDDEQEKAEEEPTHQGSISEMIRRMSRTNKWTLKNEEQKMETNGRSSRDIIERPTSLPSTPVDDYDALLTYTRKAQKAKLVQIASPRTDAPAMRTRRTVSSSPIYQSSKPMTTRTPLLTTSTVRSPTPHHHYVPISKQTFNMPLRNDEEKSDSVVPPFAKRNPQLLPAETRYSNINASSVTAVERIASVTPQRQKQREESGFGSDPVTLPAATKNPVFPAESASRQPRYGTGSSSEERLSSLISPVPYSDIFQRNRSIFEKGTSSEEPKINPYASSPSKEHKAATKVSIVSGQLTPTEKREFPERHSFDQERSNSEHISPADNSDKQLGDPNKHRVSSFPVSSTAKIEISSSAISKVMPTVEYTSSDLYTSKNSMEKSINDESTACANWDPTLLLNKLYEVSYEPRKESKLNRFTNMEGHLEVPVDDQSIYAELQKDWVQKYFRTRDGRLQWFASHFADDTPVGEVLLSGCEVDANKDENTLYIHGGRNHVKMILRIPPGVNVFDKWRKAINSHAASSYLDAFVNPVYPPLPHITEKVTIIELGSCSMRAGVLTMEPSLPQSFFPTVVLVTNDGKFIVGADALLPENRQNGELLRPLRATDTSREQYVFHRPALKACLQKCVDDLKIDPIKYRVLLSIPQNIPTVLIADLLKIVLEEMRFQGAAISRQPSLILYAYDVATGVVVDIGDCLNIVPVIDGYVVDSAIVSLPYGAAQILNALQTKFMESNIGNYVFQSPVERLILRYAMEQACYVATNYEEEVEKCQNNSSSLDTVISLKEFKPTSEMSPSFKLNSARFTATEGLFKPKRWGLDTKALHQLVFEAVQSSPIDSRKTLFRNIYLAGGVSLLPGLAERLEVEVASLAAPIIHTQVHLSPWRYNAAYLGAQVIASSTQFDQTCITLQTLSDFLRNLQNSTF